MEHVSLAGSKIRWTNILISLQLDSLDYIEDMYHSETAKTVSLSTAPALDVISLEPLAEVCLTTGFGLMP